MIEFLSVIRHSNPFSVVWDLLSFFNSRILSAFSFSKVSQNYSFPRGLIPCELSHCYELFLLFPPRPSQEPPVSSVHWTIFGSVHHASSCHLVPSLFPALTKSLLHCVCLSKHLVSLEVPFLCSKNLFPKRSQLLEQQLSMGSNSQGLSLSTDKQSGDHGSTSQNVGPLLVGVIQML